MADLSEVLEACDAWQGRNNWDKEDEFVQARDTASTLVSWLDANREWLARCELEQAARKFAGATAETPVIVRPGAIHPRLFVMGETLAVNDDVVLVGANWKPEVGR